MHLFKADEKNRLELMLSRPDVQKVIPNNVEFKFSAKTEKDNDGKEYYKMYLVNKEA